MWLAELAGATLAIDRAAAARGARAGAAARGRGARSSTALEKDRSGRCAARPRSALGTLRTPTARDRLIKRLKAEVHPRARRVIARALGDFAHDQTAARRARAGRRAAATPSYFVEAEACLALGRRARRAPASCCARPPTRESFTDVIRQHAYRGLAEARDDSALGAARRGHRAGAAPTQGRRAAAGALAAADARPPRSRGARRPRADRAAARRSRLPRPGRRDRGARRDRRSRGDPARCAA